MSEKEIKLSISPTSVEGDAEFLVNWIIGERQKGVSWAEITEGVTRELRGRDRAVTARAIKNTMTIFSNGLSEAYGAGCDSSGAIDSAREDVGEFLDKYTIGKAVKP